MGAKEDLHRAFRLKMLKDIMGGKKKNWVLVGIGVALLVFGVYIYFNPGWLTTVLEKIGIKLG